jgi:heat shock protein HslJ
MIDRRNRQLALRRHGWLAASLLLAVTACAGGETAGPPAPSGPPEALLDGTWRAEEIGGEKGLAAAQPTLRFTADGQAGGSGGCNTYAGPVSIDGDAMTFGRLASTRKACLPALLDQEQKFFIALAGARTFSVEGSQLTLRDAAGRPLARMLRGE